MFVNIFIKICSSLYFKTQPLSNENFFFNTSLNTIFNSISFILIENNLANCLRISNNYSENFLLESQYVCNVYMKDSKNIFHIPILFIFFLFLFFYYMYFYFK